MNVKFIEFILGVMRLLKLDRLSLNTYFRIIRIRPLDSDDISISKLASLGIKEGAIGIIINKNEGNLIISFEDTKVAIGKDLSKKIMVEEM